MEEKTVKSESTQKIDWKQQKEQQAQLRKKENELKKCEEQISRLEDTISSLANEMSKPENAVNSAKLNELSTKRTKAQDELDLLYETWEILSEQLES